MAWLVQPLLRMAWRPTHSSLAWPLSLLSRVEAQSLLHAREKFDEMPMKTHALLEDKPPVVTAPTFSSVTVRDHVMASVIPRANAVLTAESSSKCLMPGLGHDTGESVSANTSAATTPPTSTAAKLEIDPRSRRHWPARHAQLHHQHHMHNARQVFDGM